MLQGSEASDPEAGADLELHEQEDMRLAAASDPAAVERSSSGQNASLAIAGLPHLLQEARRASCASRQQ